MSIERHIAATGANSRCSVCEETLPGKPQYPSFDSDRLQRGLITQAEFQRCLNTYTEDLCKWDSVCEEHLATHDIVPCEYCLSLVKKTNMKAHQKTLNCVEHQRFESMAEKGYTNIDTYAPVLDMYLEAVMQVYVMDKNPEFDDHDTLIAAQELVASKKKEFIKRAQIRYALTEPSQKSNILGIKPDWTWQMWAPREVAKMLELTLGRQVAKMDGTDIVAAFKNMWEWLREENQTKRDAMLAIWLMARDARS